jgi:HD superfamily phosphohydrolase YqeK
MSAPPPEVPADLPPWAVVTPQRVEHIARVAGLLARWADERRVGAAEAARWRRAALLHDALRDAPEEVLRGYCARPERWPRSIWHGPAAAAAARRDGERDKGVLTAVHYHSLGYAPWDDAGRFLFLADYLEPGRAHERPALDALAARVVAEPETVLREVAAIKVRWLLHIGRPIPRETWDFWNSLAAGRSSSSR